MHLGLVVLLLAGAISVNANGELYYYIRPISTCLIPIFVELASTQCFVDTGRTIFVGFTERQYSVDEGSRSVRVCVTLSLSSVETIGSDYRVWLEVVPDNNPTNVPAGATPASKMRV